MLEKIKAWLVNERAEYTDPLNQNLRSLLDYDTTDATWRALADRCRAQRVVLEFIDELEKFIADCEPKENVCCEDFTRTSILNVDDAERLKHCPYCGRKITKERREKHLQ